MNRHLAILAVLTVLTGCASMTPMYQGAVSPTSSPVELKVEGLKTHGAYPNDVVWLQVIDSKKAINLGAVKFTTDVTHAPINLEQGKPFILRFHSVESHFGGFSSCAGDVPLSVKAGERYVVTYSTAKSSCKMLLTMSTESGPQVELSETTGSIGGVQFSATVTR